MVLASAFWHHSYYSVLESLLSPGHLILGCEFYFYSTPSVLSAMTLGAQRDQITSFIRPQLAAMYEMMDVKIF